MLRGCSILIADDDQEDRSFLSDAFKELNEHASLKFFENGQELINYLDTLQNNFPELIVLDLNMPRMNGREALKIIKSNQRLSKIPVVIFSTSLNDIEMQECKRLGAEEYIIKPNSFDELITIAQRFCSYCSNVKQPQ